MDDADYMDYVGYKIFMGEGREVGWEEYQLDQPEPEETPETSGSFGSSFREEKTVKKNTDGSIELTE